MSNISVIKEDEDGMIDGMHFSYSSGDFFVIEAQKKKYFYVFSMCSQP